MSERTIEFNVEHWCDVEQELIPYAVAHWKELGLYHDDIPLDLDLEKFRILDKGDMLHTVVCRLNGKPIAYHITVVSPMLHYKSTLAATTDLYYVAPEHRRTRDLIGLKLFQQAEETLAAKGVTKLIAGTKCHSDNSKFLDRLGYEFTEKIFTKVIGK